jgi:hypothetical protein
MFQAVPTEAPSAQFAISCMSERQGRASSAAKKTGKLDARFDKHDADQIEAGRLAQEVVSIDWNGRSSMTGWTPTTLHFPLESFRKVPSRLHRLSKTFNFLPLNSKNFAVRLDFSKAYNRICQFAG